MSLPILRFAKPGFTRTGAITLGLLTSLLFLFASQLSVQATTITGSSFIEETSFDDEEEDDLFNTDDLFDIEETVEVTEDLDSPIARFFSSRSQGEKCYIHRGKYLVWNPILRRNAFEYFQRVRYCWRGTRLVSANRIQTGYDLFGYPLATYKSQKTDRWGNTFWAQGRFGLCLNWNGIGCISNYTATVRMWPTRPGWSGVAYRSFDLSLDESLANDGLGDIFFADDLDEDTKTELLALVESQNSNTDPQSVPEPATLLGLGLVGLFLFKTRKSCSSKHSQNNPEN